MSNLLLKIQDPKFTFNKNQKQELADILTPNTRLPGGREVVNKILPLTIKTFNPNYNLSVYYLNKLKFSNLINPSKERNTIYNIFLDIFLSFFSLHYLMVFFFSSFLLLYTYVFHQFSKSYLLSHIVVPN